MVHQQCSKDREEPGLCTELLGATSTPEQHGKAVCNLWQTQQEKFLPCKYNQIYITCSGSFSFFHCISSSFYTSYIFNYTLPLVRRYLLHFFPNKAPAALPHVYQTGIRWQYGLETSAWGNRQDKMLVLLVPLVTWKISPNLLLLSENGGVNNDLLTSCEV